jgi:hypothetical protein
MSEIVHLTEPPKVSLLKVLATRKPGLGPGETVPPIAIQLDGILPRDVDAYARICGFPAGDSLPLPLPHILAAPLHLAIATHPKFPLPGMGLVHVSNSILQHRPIGRDEALSIVCRGDGHRPHPRGALVDLETEVFSGKERVWQSSTTVLSTAAPKGGERVPRPEGAPLLPDRSTSWRLPTNLGRQYGAISRDRNPIHMYPWTAKLFGFKSHIIHGMWLLARSLSEMDLSMDEGTVQVDIDFMRPVFLPGSVLFASGPQGDALGFCLSHPKSGKTHAAGLVRRL